MSDGFYVSGAFSRASDLEDVSQARALWSRMVAHRKSPKLKWEASVLLVGIVDDQPYPSLSLFEADTAHCPPRARGPELCRTENRVSKKDVS